MSKSRRELMVDIVLEHMRIKPGQYCPGWKALGLDRLTRRELWRMRRELRLQPKEWGADGWDDHPMAP